MWLWWILSFITLIISLLFAAKVFATTRDLQKKVRSHNLILPDSKDGPIERSIRSPRQQPFSDLGKKMKILEEHCINNSLQINTLSERFEQENRQLKKTGILNNDDTENWQELYYDILEKNEKLESAVDLSQIKLSELEDRLKEIPENNDLGARQSDIDNEHFLNESLKETVNDLRKKLAASLSRENQLRIELNEEENTKMQLQRLKQQYSKLQREAEEINKSAAHANEKDIALQERLRQLDELEHQQENGFSEKADFRIMLQGIIVENAVLTNKIADLCEKLSETKQ